MTRWLGAGLLLRGLVARRWISLALVLTAALTVGAATLGPLYARAAEESVLHDALVAAPAYRTSLTMSLPGDLAVQSIIDASVSLSPDPTPLYPRRISGRQLTTAVQADPSQTEQTDLVSRDDVCGHLTLVQGRCATGPGEAVVSARTVAGPYGFRLGSVLALPDLRSLTAPLGSPDPASLTVVGVYTPNNPSEAYWTGRTYFSAAVSFSDASPDTVDAVFVDPSTFPTLRGAKGQATVDYPLDVSAVRLSNLPDVPGQVADLVARGSTLRAADDLGSEVGSLAAARASIGTGSLLVSLQLAAVALFVLFTVTGNALEARGGDVALAKLRGLTPGATMRFLLTETLVLLAVAVPLGAGLGLLATRTLAAGLLAADIPIVFPTAALVAALGAAAAAALAAALAGRRVLRRTVIAQWRGVTRQRRVGVIAVVTEMLLAAAAAVGVVLLVTGRSGAVALLGPGLLVLAVALSAVRLIGPLARRGVRRTADSNRLGRFLALRQLARRPTALRLGVLLAVTVGLAVFAVAGESIADRNRTARASVEVGAAEVVTVQFAPQSDPVDLVRRADPDGTWAMIAARWVPNGGATVRGAVVGVDSSRLAAVGNPVTQGRSLRDIAAAIAPSVPPPVTLTGSSLSVTLDATDLQGLAPYVGVVVRPQGRPAVVVRLATLQAGVHDYRAEVPCRSGCRLTGFAWIRPVSAFDTIAGTVTVTAVTQYADATSTTGSPVDLRLGDDAAWRPHSPDGMDGQTSGSVTVTPSGLTQQFSSTGGASAGAGRVDVPDALEVWAASDAITTPPPGDDGRASPSVVTDGNQVSFPVTVGGSSPAVPDGGRLGVLADVSTLQTALPGFTGAARWSVWLGPKAPPDALTRLAQAGLGPSVVTTTAARTAELARQGPSLALALLLACALAMTALAVGATVTAVSATGRRRSFELAALRVVGVPRRSLTGSTVLEQAALLGAGLLIGVPTGIIGAVIAMPVIPQFTDASPLPLTDVPSVIRLVAVTAVFTVVLGGTAVAAGFALVRAALPSRLREVSV